MQQVVRRTVEEWMTAALTVAPSGRGIKLSFVVTRRTELPDAVSSALQVQTVSRTLQVQHRDIWNYKSCSSL